MKMLLSTVFLFAYFALPSLSLVPEYFCDEQSTECEYRNSTWIQLRNAEERFDWLASNITGFQSTSEALIREAHKRISTVNRTSIECKTLIDTHDIVSQRILRNLQENISVLNLTTVAPPIYPNQCENQCDKSSPLLLGWIVQLWDVAFQDLNPIVNYENLENIVRKGGLVELIVRIAKTVSSSSPTTNDTCNIWSCPAYLLLQSQVIQSNNLILALSKEVTEDKDELVELIGNYSKFSSWVSIAGGIITIIAGLHALLSGLGIGKGILIQRGFKKKEFLKSQVAVQEVYSAAHQVSEHEACLNLPLSFLPLDNEKSKGAVVHRLLAKNGLKILGLYDDMCIAAMLIKDHSTLPRTKDHKSFSPAVVPLATVDSCDHVNSWISAAKSIQSSICGITYTAELRSMITTMTLPLTDGKMVYQIFRTADSILARALSLYHAFQLVDMIEYYVKASDDGYARNDTVFKTTGFKCTRSPRVNLHALGEPKFLGIVIQLDTGEIAATIPSVANLRENPRSALMYMQTCLQQISQAATGMPAHMWDNKPDKLLSTYNAISASDSKTLWYSDVRPTWNKAEHLARGELFTDAAASAPAPIAVAARRGTPIQLGRSPPANAIDDDFPDMIFDPEDARVRASSSYMIPPLTPLALTYAQQAVEISHAKAALRAAKGQPEISDDQALLVTPDKVQKLFSNLRGFRASNSDTQV